MCLKYRVFSDPYFPAFGLNTERYFVSLHIQSECGKIRTRKNSVFGHFSRSEENAFRAALTMLLFRNSTNTEPRPQRIFSPYDKSEKGTIFFKLLWG